VGSGGFNCPVSTIWLVYENYLVPYLEVLEHPETMHREQAGHQSPRFVLTTRFSGLGGRSSTLFGYVMSHAAEFHHAGLPSQDRQVACV
jgi:hypothetical protein